MLKWGNSTLTIYQPTQSGSSAGWRQYQRPPKSFFSCRVPELRLELCSPWATSMTWNALHRSPTMVLDMPGWTCCTCRAPFALTVMVTSCN